MEVCKEVIEELSNNVDFVPLCPINAQDEYTLGLGYNVTDDSVAFSFNRSANILFIEKTKVDLEIGFEPKNF